MGIRRRPVRDVRGLHVGTALRLRQDQRAACALRWRSTTARAAGASPSSSSAAATAAARCSPDTKAPTVRVYAAAGRHRVTLRLRYRVRDESGRTSERLFVYRKTKLLKSFTRPLRTTDAAVAYWVGFKFAIPRLLPVLRPRDRRRGQPLARLRGDPHSVEDPAGTAGRGPRAGSLRLAENKRLAVDAQLRRIAVRPVPPVKPVVTPSLSMDLRAVVTRAPMPSSAAPRARRRRSRRRSGRLRS